jgi:hypothetical protein
MTVKKLLNPNEWTYAMGQSPGDPTKEPVVATRRWAFRHQPPYVVLCDEQSNNRS